MQYESGIKLYVHSDEVFNYSLDYWASYFGYSYWYQ